jgi:hypothetical protein
LDVRELVCGHVLGNDRAAVDGDRRGLTVEVDDLDRLHAVHVSTYRWRRERCAQFRRCLLADL